MIKRFGWLIAGWLLAANVAGAQTTAAPGEPPMPATSRAWAADDYKVLAEAIVQGRVPLPKFGAGDSDALMRRLVSEENLKFQANLAIPPAYRLKDFVETLPSLMVILGKYLEKGESGNAELAAMLAFLVREAGSGAAVLSEVIPTIPKDAAYEQRMKDSLGQVKSGVTDVLIGAEMSLGEATFSAEDKSLILDAMADSIGSLKAFLADDVKAELAQKLQIRKSAGSKTDAENIDRLLQALDS